MTAQAGVEPDKVALVLGDAVRTYGDLHTRAGRLAGALSALGAGPGRAVAVMLPNGFELFEVGAATVRGGTRLLPLNWHLKADEVAWILADSGAAVLVADEALAAVADAAAARAAGCQVLLVG
ncbi:MAG: AMP-binding protein, partial [Actinomycetota bacterium]|nr:AMP-binding protein [Actinomycetota bacterium]